MKSGPIDLNEADHIEIEVTWEDKSYKAFFALILNLAYHLNRAYKPFWFCVLQASPV